VLLSFGEKQLGESALCCSRHVAFLTLRCEKGDDGTQVLLLRWRILN
jgi:hypothetical protein